MKLGRPSLSGKGRTPRTYVGLTPDERQAVEIEAEKQCRSISEQIRWIVMLWLRDQTEKGGEKSDST